MTIFTNSAEGGTNNTAVTTGNSGGASGTAWTAVTANVAFKSDIVALGTMAYGYTGSGAVNGYARWGLGDTTKIAAGRHYFYLSTDLADGMQLVQVNGNSGATSCLMIYFTPAGTLRVGKSGSTNWYTSTYDITSNIAEWVYLDWTLNTGTGVGDGVAHVRLRRKSDDSDLIADQTITNDFGAGVNLSNALIGKVSTDNYTGNLRWDAIEVRTGADVSGLIGPVSNPAPVVTPISPQNLAAGATATINISATDDGSITSYASSIVSAKSTSTPTLTGASTATVTFTAPAAGNLVTGQTIVTDNGGATTTVEWEVRVPTTGNFTTLAIAGSGTTWTNIGGAANDGAALADASDTTYSESPDYTGVEAERKWRLQPLASRSSLQLTLRSLVTATGGTVKFRLYEGNTMRQEWTVTQATSAADQAFTVTSPGSISDWGNLWVAESVVS